MLIKKYVEGDDTTSGENLGFEVKYEGVDLVVKEERTFFSDKKPIYDYL